MLQAVLACGAGAKIVFGTFVVLCAKKTKIRLYFLRPNSFLNTLAENRLWGTTSDILSAQYFEVAKWQINSAVLAKFLIIQKTF